MSPVDPRETLRQQAEKARRALRKGTFSDEAVHTARKELKRARASLRLLRDAIGKAVYARENALLRDAARHLAPVRDAKVTLEALERILARQRGRPNGRLFRLRRELRAERQRVRRQLHASGVLTEIERSLAEAARRAERWSFPADGTPVLRSGLARIYRRGRKALAAAESEDTDANLHETRKQVKYLEKALEVLHPLGPRRLSRMVKRAKSVGDRLGDDRDLALLQDRIANDKASRDALAHIKRSRRKLQKKALKQARRLYKKKTRTLVARIMG